MDKLFYPESVAVVGVSENQKNMARMILKNLIDWGFPGDIYAVNPKGGTALDRPIYQSLLDIPGDIDNVVVLSPAKTIPGLLDDAHQKGVRYLCIETAGFSELNEEGRELGDLIKKKADEYGIKFVGPNGLGVINAERKMCLPFIPLQAWEPGPVSVIAQSGGVGIAVLMGIQEHNLTSNKFVSLGNKYSLDEVDFLRYFIKDEGTKVILVYLEGMARGREFIEAASESDKPILLFKANTTRAGAERAKSHTAALANDDRILDAAIRQAGITRVYSLEHLIQFPTTFLQPPMNGRRVSIVSPAGGLTVIAADSAEENGFEFPPLSQETRDALQQQLRSGIINIGNPIDLGDGFNMDTQLLAIDLTLAQPDVDGSIFMTSRRRPGNYSGAFKAMLRNPVPDLNELARKHNKPIVSAFISSPTLVQEYREGSKVPVYNSTDLAVKALAAFRDYCMHLKRSAFAGGAAAVPDEAVRRVASLEQGLNSGAAVFAALEAAGVPVAPFAEVSDEKELSVAIERIGFPVAMKVASGAIAHKTEAGGLRLGVENIEQAHEAYRELKQVLDSAGGGGKILIQKMAGKGVEVIIGSRRDPSFGQVLMFGLGGIFVEILKDVVFHLAPVDREEALEMTGAIKTAAMLRGARGLPPSDVGALAGAITAVGRLIAACPAISELDLNPVIVHKDGAGCTAVDVRIVIG